MSEEEPTLPPTPLSPVTVIGMPVTLHRAKRQANRDQETEETRGAGCLPSCLVFRSVCGTRLGRGHLADTCPHYGGHGKPRANWLVPADPRQRLSVAPMAEEGCWLRGGA